MKDTTLDTEVKVETFEQLLFNRSLSEDREACE